MRALETCAGSPGGKEVLDHAANISTGGPPVILIAEEETISLEFAPCGMLNLIDVASMLVENER